MSLYSNDKLNKIKIELAIDHSYSKTPILNFKSSKLFCSLESNFIAQDKLHKLDLALAVK